MLPPGMSKPLGVLGREASQQLHWQLLGVAGQDAAGQVKDAPHELLRAVLRVSAVIVDQAFRACRRQLAQHPSGVEQELGDRVGPISARKVMSSVLVPIAPLG